MAHSQGRPSPGAHLPNYHNLTHIFTSKTSVIMTEDNSLKGVLIKFAIIAMLFLVGSFIECNFGY